jgi:hypothetical protein
MAVHLDPGSSEYLAANNLSTNLPDLDTGSFTVACWCRQDNSSLAANDYWFSAFIESGGSNHPFVSARFGADQNVAIFAQGATTSATATGEAWTGTTWHLVLCIFTSPSSYRIVLDGDWANSTLGTTNLGAFSALQDIVVGAVQDSNDASPTNHWDGMLAGFCVWDVAFSESNSDTLWNSGTPRAPNLTLPSDVVQYNELYDDATATTGDNLTENGTPTYDTGNHPYTVSSGNSWYYFAQHN